MSSPTPPPLRPRPKALIFDLMGTLLNWHSSITTTLRQAMQAAAFDNHNSPQPTPEEVSQLALDWRQGFFDEIHMRFEEGMPPEDIDVTHLRVLMRLLRQREWERFGVMEGIYVEQCVRAWHHQRAWPDVVAALPKLNGEFDVIVLANGTARLQIDITKSAGLNFDLLLSSELLDLVKPAPEAYTKAMSLLKRQPEECMMVAAHAYDLRAAKKVGMQTAYLQRWTEDPKEDMDAVRAENDFFIDSREASADSGGLMELARLLGAD